MEHPTRDVLRHEVKAKQFLASNERTRLWIHGRRDGTTVNGAHRARFDSQTCTRHNDRGVAAGTLALSVVFHRTLGIRSDIFRDFSDSVFGKPFKATA